jgi:Glycosyltransferase family 87
VNGAFAAGDGLGGRRIGEIILTSAGPGLVLAAIVIYVQIFSAHLWGDAHVYLAAGERLNAGHALYHLVPGDRPIAVQPPFWTVPFLSPPFVGVAWRPLAALPSEVGVAIWGLAGWASMTAAAVWLWRRSPLLTSAGLALLSIPFAMEVGLGNVNALLLGGTVAVWAWRERALVGILIGVMVAAKIWPAFLLIWLVGQRKWAAIGLAGMSFALCCLIGVAGSSVQDVVDYLQVGSGVHVSAFSPSWLLGIPWLWMATAAVGAMTVIVVRRWAGASYTLAVVAMVLGSPVVNPNTYALLLAGLAPIAAGLSTGRQRGQNRPEPSVQPSAPLVDTPR